MPTELSPIAKAIRAQLSRHKNLTVAAGAKTDMKSDMPYYGVAAPQLRKICGAVFEAHPISMAAEWRRIIADLWDQATHREERYAAIELASYPPYQRFISLASLPLYRRMIQEGAWWDYVDSLAHRVAVLLATYPDRIKPTLRAWARHDNIWLRRVAIISQISFREQTDIALLHDCIAPSLQSPEFWLRKAIGWALREHAKANPEDVRQYLEAHQAELSPLSRREALKGFTFAKRHGTLSKTKRSSK